MLYWLCNQDHWTSNIELNMEEVRIKVKKENLELQTKIAESEAKASPYRVPV